MDEASSQIPNSQFFFEPEALRYPSFIFAPSPFSESDHPPEMARVEGRRKRSMHHIRMAMDLIRHRRLFVARRRLRPI